MKKISLINTLKKTFKSKNSANKKKTIKQNKIKSVSKIKKTKVKAKVKKAKTVAKIKKSKIQKE